MLEKLSPYFKVDYYLPRSFISAVKMDYIPEILTTRLIPSDVVLALLCYYLRTTRSMTKDSRDVSYEYLNLHLHNLYLKNCTKDSRDVSYEYLSLPNIVWRLIVFAPFLIKSPKRCLETYCFCSVSSYYYYYYYSPFFISLRHERVHGRSQELLDRIS